MAAALTEPPLIADPLSLRLEGDHDAGVDVLERWEGDAWVPHRLRPAPSVDTVTGVLRRIIARPVEPWHPSGFQHLHAELPHLASVDSRFQPDALAPAAGFSGGTDTPEQVAVLSGIAHYCGAYLGQGRLRRASADELRASSERVLTVAEWRPHDPTLHEMPGFPFVRDDDHALNWWLAGDERGETCWVPISLVHAGYLASGLDAVPPTNSHNLVGLYAGTDLQAAAERAAAHIIAHDAVARWWRKPSPLPECELPAALQPEEDRESAQDIRVLAVPTSTGVPVRLVVVDDREKDIVSLGFAAAAEPQDAALTAAAEALVQHASARDLDSPDSLIRNAERIGNGGVAGLASFDRDRRYAQTAFADARRLIDPMCHVQYGLSASSVARVRRRTIPSGSVPETGLGAQPLSALFGANTRVVVVDVTTPRVREAGYSACRVLAPAFERLTPAAFPLKIDETAPYPGW
ncbi:YcaO-like family protein [Microbacterium sp. RD1]|uniref:YcaO-like family protein n=1 Tax=Microbacterium sp. RD1 TaxID=3457313 RepID=UPI003FA53EFB